MARKNVVHAYDMIAAEDASTDITSSSTDVAHFDNASMLITYTGAPVGEIFVQALQRKVNQRITESDWVDLDFGGNQILLDGIEPDHRIILNSMPFTDIRLKYVSASGTGTLSAKLTLKQIGG